MKGVVGRGNTVSNSTRSRRFDADALKVIAWSEIHVVIWQHDESWSVHSTVVASAVISSVDYIAGEWACGRVGSFLANLQAHLPSEPRKESRSGGSPMPMSLSGTVSGHGELRPCCKLTL